MTTSEAGYPADDHVLFIRGYPECAEGGGIDSDLARDQHSRAAGQRFVVIGCLLSSNTVAYYD